jgi:transcriptional accessory protein Tex/SPT6
LNTASKQILSYISGLGPQLALRQAFWFEKGH